MVGVVELRGQFVAVRREVVDELDPHGVAGLNAERWAGAIALVGAQKQTILPDIAPGIAKVKGRIQNTVDR
jgi:hypothetical protein